MGLDLVCFKELREPYWSMSYSTFDGMRALHREAVDKACKKDKYLISKIVKEIDEKVDYDPLTLEEVDAAFYDHCDCEGSWNSEEIKSLRVYLNYTFDIYKKYVEKETCDPEHWVAVMKQLIECLEASDYIEFC